ncbi:MAG: TSUP family transporter, partial [Syntrophales bacterium]|nr:TSUP family transporter [Syntrophales bacterium]
MRHLLTGRHRPGLHRVRFGSVLLSLPLLLLFLDVKTAVPLTAMAGLLLTVFLIIPLWKHLEWKKVSPLLMGSIFGVPCGVYLLRALSSGAIMIILGIILLLYGLYGLFIRAASH